MEMLKVREALSDQLHATRTKLDAKRKMLASAQGDSNQQKKAGELSRRIEELEESAKAQEVQLQTVTESTLAESRRFREEKEDAIRLLVVDFVKLQIHYSKKMQAAWEAVLAQCDQESQQGPQQEEKQ